MTKFHGSTAAAITAMASLMALGGCNNQLEQRPRRGCSGPSSNRSDARRRTRTHGRTGGSRHERSSRPDREHGSAATPGREPGASAQPDAGLDRRLVAIPRGQVRMGEGPLGSPSRG